MKIIIKKKSTILTISVIFMLSGCGYFSGSSSGCECNNSGGIGGNNNVDIDDLADRQEQKLKRYFVSGGRGMADVSTLISETRAISYRLKADGQRERANKFDSYTDVLMYGNRTIDESIRDVQRLVKNDNVTAEGESKVCKILNKIFP